MRSQIVSGSSDESNPRAGHLRLVRSDELALHEAQPRRPRVLVVDDEVHNLDYIRRCLRSDFYVATASSASEALGLLLESEWDIILSDQRMPGMTGAELLARCLELAPGSARIIVTGYSDLEATVDAINQAKISGFVRKPFSDGDLRRVIADANCKPPAARRDDLPFRHLLDALPDALAVTQDGRLLWMNKRLTGALGAPAETLLERPFADFVHADDHPALAAATEAVVRLVPVAGAVWRAALARSPLLEPAGAELLRLRLLPEAPDLQVRPTAGRVLVVDTEVRLLHGLKRALGAYCNVTTAASTHEAIEVMHRERGFDLVLCDVFLDNYTAIELHERVQRLDRRLAERFALMSASADGEVQDLIGELGLPCLFKPFEVASVLELLERQAAVSP